MTYVCGGPSHAVKLPRLSSACCYGYAMDGPQACTCWESVFDLEQAEPIIGPPAPRPARCRDCAWNPDSPERNNGAGYGATGGELIELAYDSVPFFCHQGIRRSLFLRHPRHRNQIADHPASYRPPIVDGVPYKANGEPADICAGWTAARRRALADLEVRHDVR
jgi:hypothetical protein